MKRQSLSPGEPPSDASDEELNHQDKKICGVSHIAADDTRHRFKLQYPPSDTDESDRHLFFLYLVNFLLKGKLTLNLRRFN